MFLVAIFLLFAIAMRIAYFLSNRNANVDKLLIDNEASEKVPDTIINLRADVIRLVSEEYEITNREGIKLHGYLIPSRKGSDVYVFYSHGYRSPDGGLEFGCLYPLWEKFDYNCFFVDHRAHGKSGGTHISFGLYEAQDNMEWLRFMMKEFGEDKKIILHGQSMGAATVMMMSDKDLLEQVKCIVADCGYSCFFDEALHVLRFPANRIVMELSNFYLKLAHGIDMKKARPVDSVTWSKKPILFIHGGNDGFVPVEMGRINYEACASEKEVKVFEKGEHATSLLLYPQEYYECVRNFVSRYIV